MIPRSKAKLKIRKIIENEINKFQKEWTAEERKIYQTLDINWVVDFKRKFFKAYRLNSNHSHLFLIDSEGKLLKRLKQGNPNELQSFLDILLAEIKKF